MRWRECHALLGVVLLVLAWVPQSATAWDEQGHRLVAALAERELSASARAEVMRLLERDGGASMAQAAVWADKVREQPEYRATFAQHFVNSQRSDCRVDLDRDCSGGNCVIGAIERYRAELADRSLDDARRAVALKFLLHLVGDVHQPFHAGFADDLGGNRFQIQIDGRGTNLHAVWDHELLAQKDWDDSRWLLEWPPMPESTPVGDALQWAERSCQLLGMHAVYPKQHRIGKDYLRRHLPVVESQLRLAGHRLAVLLKKTLAGPSAPQ